MEQSSKDNKFIFDIVTPYRTYNIYAETKQDMDEWISAIRNISANYVKK